MPSKRSERVSARFGARAADYERHASLQATIAKNLAKILPDLQRPNILEVGCGTGLLTGELFSRFPDGDILATDIAPEMLETCQQNFETADERLAFAVMDGEEPMTDQTFDLIVSSMTVQWFSDPVGGLGKLARCLNPGGQLFYATIAPNGFPEWQDAVQAHGQANGMIEMPELPGVCNKSNHVVEYASGIAFLESLKAIGATTPRPGYHPMPPGRLRKLLKTLENNGVVRMTWQIVYGCIGSGDKNVT